MNRFFIRSRSWEESKVYEFEEGLREGEKVILPSDQSESGEFGSVQKRKPRIGEKPLGRILRKATEKDIKIHAENEKQKKEIISFIRKISQEEKLEMKVIDAVLSLDGKQLTVVFVSEGRIDFRKLVKDIAGKFKKVVRMQQIGSRDEARSVGGYGICGRELCCVKFGRNIKSITTEMARSQQIFHRGSERISGLCGRLMCCLAYEAEQYKEMLKGMPEIHSVVETSEGKGTVVEINAISQEVKLKLENGKYLNLKKEDLK